MPLGTAQQTITTGANFIPELWGPGVIKATEANLIARKLCWDWFEEGKDYGDTIRFPNISNFTASAKVANTQVTLQAPTEGMSTLTINRNDESSFLIENMLKVQSQFNLINYYTKKNGYAMALLMDQRITDLFSGFSQVVGAAGVDVGDTDLRDAIEFLDIADVEETDRNFVFYPTQKNALFSIEKYFRADIRGDGKSEVLTKGRLGEIYGVPVHITTNLGTSASARLNTLFHKESIASAIQFGPVTEGDYILEHLGDLVVTHSIYGEIEARDGFGVWIRS